MNASGAIVVNQTHSGNTQKFDFVESQPSSIFGRFVGGSPGPDVGYVNKCKESIGARPNEDSQSNPPFSTVTAKNTVVVSGNQRGACVAVASVLKEVPPSS